MQGPNVGLDPGTWGHALGRRQMLHCGVPRVPQDMEHFSHPRNLRHAPRWSAPSHRHGGEGSAAVSPSPQVCAAESCTSGRRTPCPLCVPHPHPPHVLWPAGCCPSARSLLNVPGERRPPRAGGPSTGPGVRPTLACWPPGCSVGSHGQASVTHDFIPPGQRPCSGIAGPQGTCLLHFFKNLANSRELGSSSC